MSKLKRLVFLLFLVFMTFGCAKPTFRIAPPPESTPQIETADFAEEIMSSLLAVKFNMNAGIIGSGILIEIDGLPYMMTALHVIDHMVDANQGFKEVACHVNTYTGKEDCADILLGPGFEHMVHIDQGTDAALVPLNRFPVGSQAAQMVEPGYDFRIGEEIWVVGCPTGAPNIVTRGILSGFTPGRGFSGALFTDSDVWFGTSGGGVFLSTGEYVGYIRAMAGSRTPNGREIAEGLNIFSPLPEGWGLQGHVERN